MRTTEYEINSMFTNRWSPRAMSGDALTDAEFLPLFEAARWAPSSYNNQPWRFIIAKRNTPEWQVLFGLMGEFNQSWAKNAALLVVIISRVNFEHNDKPSRTHSFDTGSAWENLALEGSSRGLVVHGMEGFDYDKAKVDLNIPNDFAVEAMVAVGKPGKKEDLPEQLQEKETPSTRKPLKDVLFNGSYGRSFLS